jgi:hypothetical protein
LGYCKSMPSAVRPYERLLSRPKYVKQGRARYAAHIKNRLDASAINVRRPKPAPGKQLSEVYQAPVDPEAQDLSSTT